MEILFVTATLPYPPTDGAKIRLFSLIKNLAKRHKVSLASFITSTDHPYAIHHLRAFCKEIQAIPRNPRYPATKIVKGLISRTPFPILNYSDPTMTATVRRMIQSTNFHIIQAEALQVAQYCVGSGPCTFIDLFDIQSIVMKRYAQQQRNILKHAYAQITSKKLARYESEICKTFTECLVASPGDKYILQEQMGLEHVSVISNGVDLKDYTPGRRVRDPRRIVFVARMDYIANDDGAQWFCRKILPLIRAEYSNVLFQIVGKNPSKEVQRLANHGFIEVTGFVEDVRPYIEEATVCVIPLRVGGGTRLKILEAFAMGKAVVSTSIGAEGLAVTPHRDLLIANDPDEFAKQTLRLLREPELCTRLGMAGRELVERRYGWEVIVRCLETVYEEALRRVSGNLLA